MKTEMKEYSNGIGPISKKKKKKKKKLTTANKQTNSNPSYLNGDVFLRFFLARLLDHREGAIPQHALHLVQVHHRGLLSLWE
jgi:hypothetical protein